MLTVSSSAALFINFDNIYKHLQKHDDTIEDTSAVMQLVASLRTRLHQQRTPAVVSYAYADVEQLPGGTLEQIYLMGTTAKNVLSSTCKTAPSTQMCIDVLDLAYTRPTITTYVFVAADRDYIPLLQHLRFQGHNVQLVGFRENTSGDLLATLGKEYFVDAGELLHPAPAPAIDLTKPHPLVGAALAISAPERAQVAHISLPAAEESAAPKDPRTYPAMLRDFEKSIEPAAPRDPAQDRIDVLTFLVNELSTLRQRPNGPAVELWMSPVMKKLANKYPSMGHIGQTNVIKKLDEMGVLKIERRSGTPHDYSVIILNENHEQVLAIYNRTAQAA